MRENMMDVNTYTEFDINTEVLEDSIVVNEDINRRSQKSEEKNDDDVFARRRVRGAFSYFPSAIF